MFKCQFNGEAIATPIGKMHTGLANRERLPGK